MDAILYIQAAKEAHEDMKQQLDAEIAMQEVNKASFRPPHPSDTYIHREENILGVNSPLPGDDLDYGTPV